jgi:hypothetical protein
VAKVAVKKDKYGICDQTLVFDALTLQADGQLRLDQFDEGGNFSSSSPARVLEDDGMFHMKISVSKSLPENFKIEEQQFTIMTMTPEQLSEEEKNKLAKFVLKNHQSHVKDWKLNIDEALSEANRTHFVAYLASISSLHVIRNQKGKIAATMGVSAAPDNSLVYLSMAVTASELRHQKLASLLMHQVACLYPEAVMTNYIVEPMLRNILGATAMTQAGANTVSDPSSDLEAKMRVIQEWVSELTQLKVSGFLGQILHSPPRFANGAEAVSSSSADPEQSPGMS